MFTDPSEGKEVVRRMGSEAYDEEFRKGRGRVLRGIEGERLWRLAEGWQGVRGEGKGKARL